MTWSNQLVTLANFTQETDKPEIEVSKVTLHVIRIRITLTKLYELVLPN